MSFKANRKKRISHVTSCGPFMILYGSVTKRIDEIMPFSSHLSFVRKKDKFEKKLDFSKKKKLKLDAAGIFWCWKKGSLKQK